MGVSGGLRAVSGGMWLIGNTAGPLANAARQSIALQSALGAMSGVKMTNMNRIIAGLRGIAGVMINQTIHPAPGMDEKSLARLVGQEIEMATGRVFRGIQSDTGIEAY